MDRRAFLGVLGASATALTIPTHSLAPAHAGSRRMIRELPAWGEKRTAWTVDDGTNSEAVRRYIRLVAESNIRLTFFIYSAMASWLENKKELKELVDVGQIQVANHTAHHPALATLTTKEIQRELMSAHNFIERHFDVDSRPYFRPPYGSISQRVIGAAADIGYTKPVLWSGSLGDASNIRPARILSLARSSFYDGSIVLAHANTLTSSRIFPELLEIIDKKELNLVTLADAFD